MIYDREPPPPPLPSLSYREQRPTGTPPSFQRQSPVEQQLLPLTTVVPVSEEWSSDEDEGVCTSDIALPPVEIPDTLHVHRVEVTWRDNDETCTLYATPHSRFEGSWFSNMLLLASNRIPLVAPIVVNPKKVPIVDSTGYYPGKEMPCYVFVEYLYERSFSEEEKDILRELNPGIADLRVLPALPKVPDVSYVALLPSFSSQEGEEDTIRFDLLKNALAYTKSQKEVVDILKRDDDDNTELADLVSDSVVRTIFKGDTYHVHDISEKTPLDTIRWIQNNFRKELKGAKGNYYFFYREKHDIDLKFVGRPMLVTGSSHLPPETCEVVSGVTGQMQWVGTIVQGCLLEVRKYSYMFAFLENLKEALCQLDGNIRIDKIRVENKIIQQALTHSSFSPISNERLEFVGDRVLSFAISVNLLEELPHLPDGSLYQLRTELCRNDLFGKVAAHLGMTRALMVGDNQEVSPDMSADACEAVAAALYMPDEELPNLDPVLVFCQRLLLPRCEMFQQAVETRPDSVKPGFSPPPSLVSDQLSNKAKYLLSELQRKIPYKFHNPDLLAQSMITPKTSKINYRLLSFLGDTVIRLVVATHFYRALPTSGTPGVLTEIGKLFFKSHYEFGHAARELGIHKVLIECNPRLPRDQKAGLESGSEVTELRSFQSYAFSALIGAVLLDSRFQKEAFPQEFDDCHCGQDVAGGLVHSLLLSRHPELLAPEDVQGNIEAILDSIAKAQMDAGVQLGADPSSFYDDEGDKPSAARPSLQVERSVVLYVEPPIGAHSSSRPRVVPKKKKEDLNSKEERMRQRILKQVLDQIQAVDTSPLVMFALDFEAVCALGNNEYVPNEIALVRFAIHTTSDQSISTEVLDQYHSLLYPGAIPDDFKQTVAYGRKRIHGINYDRKEEGATDEFHQVWSRIVSVIEQSPPPRLLLVKGHAEGTDVGCLRWVAYKASKSIKDLNIFVMDIIEIIDYLKAHLSSSRPRDPSLAHPYPKPSHHLKCDFHLSRASEFHCALADTMALVEHVEASFGTMLGCSRSRLESEGHNDRGRHQTRVQDEYTEKPSHVSSEYGVDDNRTTRPRVQEDDRGKDQHHDKHSSEEEPRHGGGDMEEKAQHDERDTEEARKENKESSSAIPPATGQSSASASHTAKRDTTVEQVHKVDLIVDLDEDPLLSAKECLERVRLLIQNAEKAANVEDRMEIFGSAHEALLLAKDYVYQGSYNFPEYNEVLIRAVSNQALISWKLKDYRDVIGYSDEVLEYSEGNNAKAHYRKAFGLHVLLKEEMDEVQKMGMLEEAKWHASEALRLEPKDTNIASLCKELGVE